MSFVKWLSRRAILDRLNRIIELADGRRGNGLSEGPRHSMDEVHQDVYEAAINMRAVLMQHNLETALPIVRQIYERYANIVEAKGRPANDLHTGWENYRSYSDKVKGWLFSIPEMIEDALKGKHPNEANYQNLE